MWEFIHIFVCWLVKEITACLRLMEECESEMQKFERAREKVVRDKEAIDTKNNEQKELNVKEQVCIILHSGDTWLWR